MSFVAWFGVGGYVAAMSKRVADAGKLAPKPMTQMSPPPPQSNESNDEKGEDEEDEE